MAIPASYTEKTLAEFMYASLGKVASVLTVRLSPDGPGDLAEPVNDALLEYGTQTIGDITGVDNLRKLRAAARVAIWKYVVANFAALYDFSADGASYDRSQMFKHATEALTLAENDLMAFSSQYSARVVSLRYIHDPYAYSEDLDEFGE